jgi:hypothetical protein
MLQARRSLVRVAVRSSKQKTNSVAFSPRANYTDWSTATCRRNLMSTFVDRGVSRDQRGGSPTVVNLNFLDRSEDISGAKARSERKANLTPSIIRLSAKIQILNISQSYMSPRPITARAILLYIWIMFVRQGNTHRASTTYTEIKQRNKQTPWPLVRERTIPTEWPPLVGEI